MWRDSALLGFVKRGRCRDIGRQEDIGRYHWRDIERREHCFPKYLLSAKKQRVQGEKKDLANPGSCWSR
ncbi:hypothetical protein CapIbe_015895 [Capra ibex]